MYDTGCSIKNVQYDEAIGIGERRERGDVLVELFISGCAVPSISEKFNYKKL